MSDLREIESIMLNGEEYTPGGSKVIPEGLIDPMDIEYAILVNGVTNKITEFYPINMVVNLPDIDGGGNYIREVEKSSYMDSATRSWGKVIFPSHLESIPDEFVRDRNLTSVTFGDHLYEIGSGAFRGNKLTHIDWGNSAPLIGTRAFNSNNLKSVTIKPNSTYLGSTLGSYAFAGNELTEVNLLEGMTNIPDGCFSHNKLTELPNLPSTLTQIGEDAFHSNPFNSPNVIIPPSVEFISYNAFGKQGKNIVFEDLPNASTLKSLLMPPSGPYDTVSGIESISVINPIDIPADYLSFSATDYNRFALHYSSSRDWPKIRLAPGSTWQNSPGKISIKIMQNGSWFSYPTTRWSGEEGYLI